MEFKTASLEDFDIVFGYIEQLWSFNTYDKAKIFEVYKRVIEAPDTFAILLISGGAAKGFCHGVYFDTFWMSGRTCYISSLITNADEREKGYGTALLNHAKELATKKSCNAIILDSGFQRKKAHSFYEHYGFGKGCYGFELLL